MKIQRPTSQSNPDISAQVASSAPSSPSLAQAQSPAVSATTSQALPSESSNPSQLAQLLGQNGQSNPLPELSTTSQSRAGKTVGLSSFGMLQQVSRIEEGRTTPTQAFAAIDMGSNSAKMLILQQQADGSIQTLRDLKIGTRLGQDVQPGDAIPEANQERTRKALQSFLEEASQFGIAPSQIGLISTAAVRNSSNGEAFVQQLRSDLGLTQARILTGEQEAEVGYLGTIDALRKREGTPAEARFATLDLGGGSFQMAVGSRDAVEQGASTQIGSNYILDEIFPKDRETLTDADFAKVDSTLKQVAPMPLDSAMLAQRTLVATGGVSKFLRSHFGKDTISRQEIDAFRREVGALPEAQRTDIIQQGKDQTTQKALGVDTLEGALDYGKKLPASASLLLHIMDSLDLQELQVSTSDARHAVIAQLQTDAQTIA